MLGELVRWWDSLVEPPAPLRPGEKLAAWIATLLTALTRWYALSSTPWDWDEALFILGVRSFDVRQHHPHPPGFPLFIGIAKVFHWMGLTPFHALRAESILASVAIVPAMLFLGRELRMRAPAALTAGVFLAFFPNVWFYGGTAFSDIPSMTLVLLAMGMLMRGARSDGALLVGAATLGCAIAFRPQNLMIGCVPAGIAAARGLPRKWLRVIAAAIVAGAIVAIAFGIAARESGGWAEYRDVVHAHGQYITTVDSYHAPGRPPLWRIFEEFFVRPYHVAAVNILVCLLVAISMLSAFRTERAPMLVLALSFAPFCVAAWLYLDHFSTSRFSIGYAPWFAFLMADGVALIAAGRRRIEAAIAVAVSAVMLISTVPAIRDVRHHASPTWAAAEWLRQHFDSRQGTLYVHEGMLPFVQAFLPDVPFSTVLAPPSMTHAFRRGDVYVAEGVLPGSTVFAMPRRWLSRIARDRYFEVSLTPIVRLTAFREGWYDAEGSGSETFRWMGRSGTVELPPVSARTASLHLRLYVPLDALHVTPHLRLLWNGAPVAAFDGRTPEIDRSLSVQPRSDRPNLLVIETDRIVNPAAEHLSGDARDLGVRLDSIEFGPP